MSKYFKIKVNVGDGRTKWVASGHGDLYPAAEKLAMYFTEKTIRSGEVQQFMNDHNCEIVLATDLPRREWFIYEP